MGIIRFSKARAVSHSCFTHLEASALLQQRFFEKLSEEGISIVQSTSTYIDITVTIGKDTTILPCSTIRGNTQIGNNCIIGPDVHLKDCSIGDNCVISSKVLKNEDIPSNKIIEK